MISRTQRQLGVLHFDYYNKLHHTHTHTHVMVFLNAVIQQSTTHLMERYGTKDRHDIAKRI